MVGARVFSLLLLFAASLSAAGAATSTVRPAATGTVTYSLSAGVLDAADTRVVSSCEAPSGQAVFRRGYAEFDLSDVGFEVATATLTVHEAFEVGEFALPVALHELSWYPADLVVDAADLGATATPITSFVTDDGDPGRFFDIDVTAAVQAMAGGSIGFRIDLAADPNDPCGADGSLGAAFDGLMEAGPPLLTLTAVEPLAVPVDIEPTECPSPLARYDNKLQVAINGYGNLDVRLIDPTSVRIWGVAPMKSQIRDVSAPYFPLVGKEGPFACLSDGRDGVPDLLLVFDPRAIIAAIESVLYRPSGLLEGEVLRLRLEGRLTPEAGGEPFVGEDIVVVHLRR